MASCYPAYLYIWQHVPVYIVKCDCMYSSAIPAVLFPAFHKKLLAF